ncbi:uncharacterized protein LOC141596591 [Silene latifolia]|uniref:uncharacterized protein LOC141596591 n=1 Tax=Silene latifolia TaxID=37657 RepID=UPI003D7784F2
MRNPPPLPPSRQPPQEDTHLLEINLISAQNLKPPPSSNFRRMQTYAVAYINPNSKLRTRIDRIGADNPTWNDKFIFRVSSDFLSGETSAVTVDIFAVGVLTDALLGSVRLLLCHVISPVSHLGVPEFVAVQVRRPSGRYQGVLNVGAALIDVGDVKSSLFGVSAIGYADMMGERKVKRWSHRRGVSEVSSGSESWGGDSDGSESTASTNSSSTTSSGVLRELNGREGDGVGRILCGLGLKKGRENVSFSDDDIIRAFGALNLNSG